ncbi:hypothetical protein DL769_000014 [Monosporascus sp. CRB-8-3]|nr:hypothetical protein DL769_000014 [Monosporascus sp. CRB-8-3]
MSDRSTPGQAWACPMPSLLSPPTLDSDDTDDEVTGSTRVVPPVATPAYGQRGTPLRFEDDEEARLFMHYVHDLSSWIDVCDRKCHFGLEVPRRACRFPLLSYGILAFSSRFIALVSGVGRGRAADYHSRAVQMLIPILDGPIEALDENLLAAIVLLHTDVGTHLYGSARLLNTASSLAATGGLGEAASWVVLRQDIYVSLTKSQPLCIQLDHYRRSSSFINDDAESLANRAVFLCGQVLAYAFGSGTTFPTLDDDEWTRLNDDADRWLMSMPVDFTPFWVDGLVGKNVDGPVFPAVWMTRPAHSECHG